jgi:superfamily II DNA/RNA helicase
VSADYRLPQVLIVAPTRELAVQIHDVVAQIGCHTRIKCAEATGAHGAPQSRRTLVP